MNVRNTKRTFEQEFEECWNVIQTSHPDLRRMLILMTATGLPQKFLMDLTWEQFQYKPAYGIYVASVDTKVIFIFNETMDLLRSIKTNYTDTVFYERRAFTYWKQLMFACRNNNLPVLNIEYFMLKKKKEYVRILPQDISGALLHGYECVNALYGGNITEKDVLQTLSEHKHLLFIPG